MTGQDEVVPFSQLPNLIEQLSNALKYFRDSLPHREGGVRDGLADEFFDVWLKWQREQSLGRLS